MALANPVSNEETSTNPATGRVLGDVAPASTQDGAVTKFRDADDEIASGLGDNKAIWDDHDHDPANPTGPGGPPIGTGGARSIAAAAVQNALIAANAITGAKTAAGAIQTSHIQDETVESGQLGDPESRTQTIAPGATMTWSHNRGYLVLWHAEADSPEFENCVLHSDVDSMYVHNPVSNSLDVEVTLRAYG